MGYAHGVRTNFESAALRTQGPRTGYKEASR